MGRRFSDDDDADTAVNANTPPSGDDQEKRKQHAVDAARNRPDGTFIENSENPGQFKTEQRSDGKHELSELDAPEVLGFALPHWRKWMILTVIFLVQCSMNYNAAVYANGVDFLTEKFNISAQAARVGQAVFLVSYGFGCELWAPWSEELGRWPTLQLSLFLVNSE